MNIDGQNPCDVCKAKGKASGCSGCVLDEGSYDECGNDISEEQRVKPSCKTCKHYTAGEYDGSCGSYICKDMSDWEGQA